MTNLIITIKNLIERYIYNLYQEYLLKNNLLLIESNSIQDIIGAMYSENTKAIKQHIRTSLKTDMADEYPGGSVENILLDIFQDRDTNILKLTNIIDDYQKTNYIEVDKSIVNNRLGISIKFDGSFCMIGGVKGQCEEHLTADNIIEKYQYLYSINGEIINLNEDPISCIKTLVSHNERVTIGLYRLIEN